VQDTLTLILTCATDCRYARKKGIGCCVVTFSVGGFSVLNAIAGAMSEVCVCAVGLVCMRPHASAGAMSEVCACMNTCMLPCACALEK